MDPANTYDLVPYGSHKFPQTHPDRMATLAHVFGISAPDVTDCRVLELGCAGGGNLIPMASVLPGSEFVGVDLSAREVATGRDMIQAPGLTNVRIEHASITDVDASWGSFDYIICHGVFSWVGKNVQDRIFEIAASLLAPKGVAYVSYNTYPGWHMREMIRHMMRYHVARFEEPAEQISQARGLLDFLAASVPPDRNAYGQFLSGELDVLRKYSDSYLFHEHLEHVNTPMYFHQFIERAEDFGLQYLAEAEFSTMLSGRLPESVRETLERISPNIIQLEQYIDFVRNRLFRQTLLCRKEVTPRRALSPAVLQGLLLSSPLRATTEPVDLSDRLKARFSEGASAHAESDAPATKAALVILSEHWPRGVPLEQLISAAQERAAAFISGRDGEITRQRLMQDLFQCFMANVVQARTSQPPCVREVPLRPRAFALAAYQAKTQDDVVNVLHQTIALDGLTREVVKTADGTREYREIVEHACELVRKGVLKVATGSESVTDEARLRESMTPAIAEALRTLARHALLVASDVSPE